MVLFAKKSWGLTLFEVLIAMVILAILLASAVPAYQKQIMRSHRADAIQALFSIQLAEEKYRINNSSYGTLSDVWGGISATEGGYYTLSISNLTSTTYTITATAVGSQANDSDGGSSCASLVLTYDSGTTTKTPSACWME